MNKYNWNYPTTMWVGENRINDIAIACQNLGISKPLLVTDKGLAETDIVKKTLTILKDNKISTELYFNVVGNPTGTNVTEGANYYNKNNCDGVIAFGGGSGLDVGKAIAFMSGQTLSWSHANISPVLPNPVATSSNMSKISNLSQSFLISFK